LEDPLSGKGTRNERGGKTTTRKRRFTVKGKERWLFREEKKKRTGHGGKEKRPFVPKKTPSAEEIRLLPLEGGKKGIRDLGDSWSGTRSSANWGGKTQGKKHLWPKNKEENLDGN